MSLVCVDVQQSGGHGEPCPDCEAPSAQCCDHCFMVEDDE